MTRAALDDFRSRCSRCKRQPTHRIDTQRYFCTQHYKEFADGHEDTELKRLRKALRSVRSTINQWTIVEYDDIRVVYDIIHKALHPTKPK